MRPPFSLVPLLPVAASFICGIITAEYNIHPILTALPLTGAVALYLRGHSLWAICAVALSLGWINAEIQSPKPLLHELSGRKAVFSNALVHSTSETETSRHITAHIETVGSCRISMPSLHPAIEPGDYISFTAELSSPENRHDLPDEFDTETFMQHQGIVATAYIQPEDVTVTGQSDNLIWKIRRMRPHFISMLGQSKLSDNTTEFLVATIFGDDSLLSPETREKFATAGLAHILALSGLHVGIIALLVAILLFPLQIAGYRNLRFTITIILLWGYAIMTGMSPSVTRAVIMTTTYLISLILQRRHSAMNALLLAALVILIYDPLSIYSVGFQLSFAAVISILLFANRLNPIHPRHRTAYYLASLVSVSISAMLGTGIIAAYYFHSFPLYFLAGNIMAVSLLPFVLGGGMLILILQPLGLDWQWLCSSIDFIYNLIYSITLFFNKLPGAEINNLYFSAWLMIPFFLALTSVLFAITTRRIVWFINTAMLAAATFVSFAINQPSYPQQEYFIPRDTYYTNIIVRDSTSLFLFTTAHNSRTAEVLEQARSRYRDYMGRRMIDSITLVTDTFDSPAIQRQGNDIHTNGKHFVIVKNKDYHHETHPDYAIVCRGFRGNITDVYYDILPDSILLSNDLHPHRHDRYLNECLKAGIPVRSLKR